MMVETVVGILVPAVRVCYGTSGNGVDILVGRPSVGISVGFCVLLVS